MALVRARAASTLDVAEQIGALGQVDMDVGAEAAPFRCGSPPAASRKSDVREEPRSRVWLAPGFGSAHGKRLSDLILRPAEVQNRARCARARADHPARSGRADRPGDLVSPCPPGTPRSGALPRSGFTHCSERRPFTITRIRATRMRVARFCRRVRRTGLPQQSRGTSGQCDVNVPFSAIVKWPRTPNAPVALPAFVFDRRAAPEGKVCLQPGGELGPTVPKGGALGRLPLLPRVRGRPGHRGRHWRGAPSRPGTVFSRRARSRLRGVAAPLIEKKEERGPEEPEHPTQPTAFGTMVFSGNQGGPTRSATRARRQSTRRPGHSHRSSRPALASLPRAGERRVRAIPLAAPVVRSSIDTSAVSTIFLFCRTTSSDPEMNLPIASLGFTSCSLSERGKARQCAP